MTSQTRAPKINRISDLSTDEAKWVEFKKIEWTDQTGRERVWEAASRKTRGKTGVDAVAIAPILIFPSRPPSTLIILQYRPPVEAMCVEFPAGLIDANESPEEAAVRELKEETGYEGRVLSLSPTIVADPGLTTANMQLATVEVQIKDGEEEPLQHLDEGENIERVIVPLSELHDRLMGTTTSYSKEKGTIVDARLFHWAADVEDLGNYCHVKLDVEAFGGPLPRWINSKTRVLEWLEKQITL